MKREELGDLYAFLAVAEAQSFTRAAARLGTSQSALSHTVKKLEERLGTRLLTRTTRNVSPTEAGEKLAESLRPAFADIATGLEQLNDFRSKPAGTIRISSSRWPAQHILLPVVKALMKEHPDLNFEIAVDQRLTDIVSDRFDAGIRLGESVEKDMIAVRIGPEIRMAVVGSPHYFERNAIPREPQELAAHRCINIRLPSRGVLYAWEFEKGDRELNVRVDGQFTSNDPDMIIDAALDGLGLACLPWDYLQEHVEAGRLILVLDDWQPPFPGYYLYYPNRRQNSSAFKLLVEGLRYKGGS